MTFWQRWRRAVDPIDQRAKDLVGFAERRLGEALPELAQRVPGLALVSAERWQRHSTIAVAQLAAFPLLRAVRGDEKRYDRLLRVIRAQIRVTYPDSDPLWVRAECATIPPTGRERTKTLADIDETQALALGRWVLVSVAGDSAIGARWDNVREVSRTLQAAVADYWEIR